MGWSDGKIRLGEKREELGKEYNRGDAAEAFKLFVLFFQYSSIFLIILHISLCPCCCFHPILCSFLLPFYPFFVTAFYLFFLFFFPWGWYFFTPSSSSFWSPGAQSFSVCFHLIRVSAKTVPALHGAELASCPSTLPVSKIYCHLFGRKNWFSSLEEAYVIQKSCWGRRRHV